MGNLDRNNFELAMTIIRGRYETGHEPHSLIVNGSSVFGDLWETWFALHVTERGKADCTACDGRGTLWLNPGEERDNRTKSWPRCAGQGARLPMRPLSRGEYLKVEYTAADLPLISTFSRGNCACVSETEGEMSGLDWASS